MDENTICTTLAPLFGDLVEDFRDSFDDFNHLVPTEAQPSLLGARAKITSERLAYRVEQRYGRDRRDPIRVQEVGGMTVLLVEGEHYDIGLRLKKFDGEYRSYNHRSCQQDELRRTGRFSTASFEDLDFPLAHVFFGYRCSEGLNPRIRDIAVTFEGMSVHGRYFVDWQRVIWTPTDGFNPPQRGTPPLFPPDEPNFDIQPKPDTGKRKAEGE